VLTAHLSLGVGRFAFELTQKRTASLGDPPSLISWRPFCAEGE
jgi:hypothetical protein